MITFCKQCKLKYEFYSNDSIQKLEFCSDICHQTYWLNNGVGLFHRKIGRVIPKALPKEFNL